MISSTGTGYPTHHKMDRVINMETLKKHMESYLLRKQNL